jgi:hypothetical protein
MGKPVGILAFAIVVLPALPAASQSQYSCRPDIELGERHASQPWALVRCVIFATNLIYLISVIVQS